MNFWEELGLNPGASEPEIKSRFRDLAKKYHPDNQVTGDVTKFRRIILAYEVLTGKVKTSEADGAADSTSDSQVKFTVQVSPKIINLGNLEWDEMAKGSFTLVIQGDFTDVEVDIDWNNQPAWVSDLSHESDNPNKFVFYFQARASMLEQGQHNTSIDIVFTCGSDGKELVRINLPVNCHVLKLVNVSVGLDGVDGIYLGPIEVGETTKGTAIIVNKGKPLFDLPIFEWHNRPAWAGAIRLTQEKGRVFPVKISFDVNSSGLDYRQSPCKANVVVKVGSQTIGSIPVVLRLTKVPEPIFKANPQVVNFGVLDWCESRQIDIRISNDGDPPKETIHIQDTDYSHWLQIANLSPADATTFPKVLRLQAKALGTNHGDYLSKVSLWYQRWQIKIPVSVRVKPIPTLTSSTGTIRGTFKRGDVATFRLIVDKSDGPVPTLTISYRNTDYVARKPQVVNEDWPVTIVLSFDFEGEDIGHLRNTLVCEVQTQSDVFGSMLTVPVEIEVV